LSFGQLMPQLLAASHPRAFLNLVGAEQVLLLTLCFESLGVTHFSWLLAGAAKRLGCCSAASRSRSGKKGGDEDTVVRMGTTQDGTSGGSSASICCPKHVPVRGQHSSSAGATCKLWD